MARGRHAAPRRERAAARKRAAQARKRFAREKEREAGELDVDGLFPDDHGDQLGDAGRPDVEDPDPGRREAGDADGAEGGADEATADEAISVEGVADVAEATADEADRDEAAADEAAEDDGDGAARTPAASTAAERRSARPRGRERGPGRVLATILLGVAVAAAVAVLTVVLVDGDGGLVTAERTGAGAGAGPAQDTLLLVRHAGDGGAAAGMTLLAVDAEGGAAVLLLPVGTLADIPGVGLDRLGLAHQYGGPALAQATVENLLGIEIDEVAAVDERGLGALLGRTGGFEVTVPDRLVVRAEDGTAAVRFEPGDQFLDGRRLAEYWGFRARGEDELASFSRQQQVLSAWLDELRDDEIFSSVTADGMPQLDTAADPEWMRSLIAGLVAARGGDGLGVTLLPVEAFGGEGPDGTSTFRPRTAAIASLVDDVFAGSVPAAGEGGAVRVQVLNGVGVPGIGERVDQRLGSGAFRIVLTDNARDFDFAETRILVYDESQRSMEAAERVRERLGVGTIQVSRQPQSVVDLTIVVGADFLDGEDAASLPQPPAPDEE